MPLALLGAAVVMGLALGLVGAGGSILAVPALVYLGGMTSHDATVVSLLVVGASAAAGGAVNAARGLVAWPVVGRVVLGGIVGTVIGTAVNQRLDGDLLLGLLALAMLTAAASMWRGQPQGADAPAPPAHRGTRLVLVGIALGIVTGLLGIGGGFLVVPMLVLVARVQMHRAVGTSLVLIAASALLALADHLVLGSTVEPGAWRIGAVVAAIGAAGVLAGAAIGGRLPAGALRRAFAIMLVPIAMLMLVDAATGLGVA